MFTRVNPNSAIYKWSVRWSGDSNKNQQHTILWRTDGNQDKNPSIILYCEKFISMETFT